LREKVARSPANAQRQPALSRSFGRRYNRLAIREEGDPVSDKAAAPDSSPRETLQARIDALARVRLAHLPTPLDHCPRLSAALGGPEIWVKRDDLTGLAFGGNKTRQLEFVFADVLARGADTVVAGAYTQSNWCRQITAAARKLGLEVSLVLLHGEKGPALQGNLLLDRLMGADVTVVDLDSMERLAPLLEAKAEELGRAGRRPYVLAPFAVDRLALGAIGYVAAALELDRQLEEEAGIDPDYLYLCGANMTPAGMALGLKALGRRARLINIAPIRWSEPRAADIARIANATAERLAVDLRLIAEQVESHDDYIGERYGVVTEGGREAMQLLARTEAIILDPVYSSKAMAGLIDHVRRGRIGRGETVVFLHTGGTPALFAYAADLGLG
jgi:D-cysteine desulfhydrase family pyridoxal phosphate-dependent enzyme